MFLKKKKKKLYQGMELSSPKSKKFLIFFQNKVFLIFQEGTFQVRKTKKLTWKN